MERTTRRVTLTAVGRDFDRKMRELLDELDTTLLAVRGVAATRMGEVTVALRPVDGLLLPIQCDPSLS
jgi:DNA-binding transcriptional LysR family regulator